MSGNCLLSFLSLLYLQVQNVHVNKNINCTRQSTSHFTTQNSFLSILGDVESTGTICLYGCTIIGTQRLRKPVIMRVYAGITTTHSITSAPRPSRKLPTHSVSPQAKFGKSRPAFSSSSSSHLSRPFSFFSSFFIFFFSPISSCLLLLLFRLQSSSSSSHLPHPPYLEPRLS